MPQVEYVLTFQDDADFATWLTEEMPQCGEWLPWERAKDERIAWLAVYTVEPHQAEHVTGLVGYYFRGRLGMVDAFDLLEMAAVGAEEPGRGRLFIFRCDLEESHSSRPYERVEEEFFALLDSGTPVRTTDKAGPGTKGTRKAEALRGRYWLAWS